jgi:hypothetical protein
MKTAGEAAGATMHIIGKWRFLSLGPDSLPSVRLPFVPFFG